jgi:DNA polymerase-3 subunit delta
MKLTQIDEDIKSKEFHHAYLLYGDELYLRNQYKKRLIHALMPQEDQMNLNYYKEDSIDVKDIISTAEQFPFSLFSMGEEPKRVIVIEDSKFFKKKEEEIDAYMEHIPDYCYFIFLESEVNKNNALFKKFQKSEALVSEEMKMVSGADLAKWMGGRLTKLGKKITRDAWAEFSVRAGSSMELMDQEYEKLVSYCWDKEVIELEDVEAICTGAVETQIFKMIDSIAGKDTDAAMRYYRDILRENKESKENNQASMKIFALIVKTFRQILAIQEMTEDHIDMETMKKITGVYQDFVIRKNMNLARRIPRNTMQKMLRDAANYEQQVKTGLLDEQIAVELLIMTYAK